jgi:hypothetical protein
MCWARFAEYRVGVFLHAEGVFGYRLVADGHHHHIGVDRWDVYVHRDQLSL